MKPMESMGKNPFRIRPLWWLAQGLLILLGCFFLAFGVELLMAAYRLPDPFTFIMTFFAASLIILISAALVVGFLLRLRSVYQYLKVPPNNGLDTDMDSSITAGDDERPAESPERSPR